MLRNLMSVQTHRRARIQKKGIGSLRRKTAKKLRDGKEGRTK